MLELFGKMVIDLKMRYFVLYSLVFLLFRLNLYSQVCEDYGNYLSWNSPAQIEDWNGWNTILQKTFKSILEYSSLRSNYYKILILDADCFNAEANANGQILVYKGTLNAIDKRIEEKYLQEETKDRNKFCLSLEVCREKLIAPIIAHELAHYFHNDHVALQLIHKTKNPSEIRKKIYFIEEKADTYAYSILQRSMYGEVSMLETLSMLKEMEQTLNEDPEKRKDPYLRNHPSPNSRLSKITTKVGDKRYFDWAVQIEETFASIRKGNDLSKNLDFIETSLKMFPDNLELLTARAVCLHKVWMQSATISELHLKSIVDMPLFSDNNKFEKIRKSSAIGDNHKYLQAKSAYEELLKKVNLVFFKSNYSVLLAYSNKISDREKAIQIAEEAYKETPNFSNLAFHTLNNLAVVYFLCGKREIARSFLAYICIKYGWNELFSTSKSEPETKDYASYVKKLQINDDYANDNRFIALLNYCLASNQLEYCKENTFFKSNFYFSEWLAFINKL